MRITVSAVASSLCQFRLAVICALATGVSTIPAADACDCEGMLSTLEVEAGKLPPVEVRDAVFDCAGIKGMVRNLDELDKDLIFIRARGFSEERFAKAGTETTPSVRYEQLLPESKRKLLRDYIGRLKVVSLPMHAVEKIGN